MQLRFDSVTPADLDALVAWLPRQHWPFNLIERVDAAWVRQRAETDYFWGPEVRSFWAFDPAGVPLGLLRAFEFGDITPLIDLRVADAARGHGVGSALLAWVTAHLFESEPQLARLGGYTRHDNSAMRRVFQKCGYAEEAYHRRAWRTPDGSLADSVGYAALRPERIAEPRQGARHRGSCLCGNVRYELFGELGDFAYCHCRSCQKASGSAYAANVPVARKDFALLSGANTLREFESSAGKRRVFCARCGSPLYAYVTATPDVLRVRLGSLDTPFTHAPTAHIWTSEAAHWSPIADSIPQFSEWPPRELLAQAGSKQP